MDEKKKSKTAETAEQATPSKSPPAPELPAVNEPVFSLERLRRDCFKVFGITASTFDAATYGLTGEFSVNAIREKIQAFQNMRVTPVNKGGK